jgi:hemerythrin
MFKWKDAYSCNIAKIDEQHKKLLSIGEKLYDIVRSKNYLDHYDEIMQILYEMRDYTVYHFNYEEELMEKYGFELLDLQRKQHQQFVKKINAFAKQDIDEEQNRISLELVTFVADWIEHHILGSDQKYMEFFNQKGVF